MLRYASLFPCPDTPHSAKQCLCVSAHWSALAYQFLSRLCLRFACLCNAIATLACHFEAVASPTCDLLCHRFDIIRLALAFRFLSMPPHDSSLQSKPSRSPASHIYAFTSHSSLYRCIPRCAVAAPGLSILCLRRSSRFRTLLCRCIAHRTKPSQCDSAPYRFIALSAEPQQIAASQSRSTYAISSHWNFPLPEFRH